jgi:hypothetical protein
MHNDLLILNAIQEVVDGVVVGQHVHGRFKAGLQPTAKPGQPVGFTKRLFLTIRSAAV